MKKVLALSALTLLATSGAYADSYNITSGAYDFWLAISPGTSTDSNGDGTLDCTATAPCVGQFTGTNSLGTVTGAPGATISMSVTGTVTFAGAGTSGAVTALVLNEVGTSDSTVVPGVVTLTTTGMVWTWSASGGNLGPDSLRQTAGSASCTGTTPTNSGCVNTAPAITQNLDSVWDWDGINPAVRAQGGGINPIDTQAFDHSVSGLTLTVSTGSRTLYGNSNTGLFNTANQGRYTLNLEAIAAIPVPAAVWLFGSALGLMGAVRRRAGK